MLNNDVYENFLLSILRITKADTVSLFLNSLYHGNMLLNKGNGNPLPEFANAEQALSVSKDLNQRIKSSGAPEDIPVTAWKSGSDNGYLLQIKLASFAKSILSFQAGHRRVLDQQDDQEELYGSLIIGLNFSSQQAPALIQRLIDDDIFLDEAPVSNEAWFVHFLCMGSMLSWNAYQCASLFKDPVSKLPGRMEFQTCLKKTLYEASLDQSTVGIILVNPDEFAMINQRLGREQGDMGMEEISQKLISFLRSNDLVFRYGGAMFALILPKTTLEDVELLTEKLRKGMAGTYLKESAHLTFSVGASIFEDCNTTNLHESIARIVKQADQALSLAKLSGGGKSVVWNKTSAESNSLGYERLNNIFTSESEKDYRNMLLLWDTIAVISAGSNAVTIAADFVERVKLTLKPFRIGLFESKDTNFVPLATSYGREDGQEIIGKEWNLSQAQIDLLNAVKQASQTERARFSDKTILHHQVIKLVAYGFPLLVREQLMGYLYVDGPDNSFYLDSSDLVFLNALTRQLALALDRAALESRWKEEKEKESRMLREEVRELRQVIHSAKLVYRSPQMQSLMETLSTIAPTDITVLITGESGTGKEMLARAVHEQSSRSKKPLVTVDCGAIAHSLMEAELFGKVKGAYTGAESSSPGRILQAEGGSLFLDEIGELPLDVQAKLLRFVQEKEINPVGGSQTKQVDVRIIAATNRNLADEVTAGRFRGDLYYRLQVITLMAPPLRDRADDILPLARHFLEKFSVQYGKGMLSFSPDAEKALLNYKWPGNIRELQNTIMRAVIVSKDEKIGSDILNLSSGNSEARYLGSAPVQSNEDQYSVGGVEISPIQPINPVSSPKQDCWAKLRASLAEKIESIVSQNKIIAIPIGRWLTEDMILAADQVDNGISRRASLRLGLPETTFRRQLEKIKQAEQAGVLSRSSSWDDMPEILLELVKDLTEEAQDNVIENAKMILLEEIVKKIPSNKSLGSVFMGVTLPTYQKWLERLAG